jgi:hypothetical protein
MQGAQLKDETEDHARQAEEPDRVPGQVPDQPQIKALRLILPGAKALAYRGGGCAEARDEGQQDRLIHAVRPAAAAAVAAATVAGAFPMILRSGEQPS